MSRYCTLVLGPFWITLALYVRTGDPKLAAAVGIAVAVMVFILAELFISDEPLRWSEVRRDLVHAALSAGTAQIALVISAAFIGWQQRLALDWPLVPQVLAIVVGSDLLGYWAHRAQHRFASLWAGHALHHTPDRLYWLNGLRAHPTDTAWVFIVSTVWTLIAGFSVEAFMLASVIQTTFLVMQHTPLEFSHQIQVLFVTPAWHRVHHHTSEEQANLGHIFTIWDRLFGTYVASGTSTHALGVDGVAPGTIAEELSLPFALSER